MRGALRLIALMLLRPAGTLAPVGARALRVLAGRRSSTHAWTCRTGHAILCAAADDGPAFRRRSPAVQLSTVAAAEAALQDVSAPTPPRDASDAGPVAEPAAAAPVPEIATVFEVEDVVTAEAVVERLMAMPPHTIHACDTEVADIDISKSPIGQGRVTCVSLYSGPEADYGRGKGQALWIDTTDEAVLHVFRPFLESERHLKAWHNYAFDRHVLWNHGIDVRGLGGDTMHMARLWDASRKTGYSLAALTEELLDRRKVKMQEIFGVPVLKKDGTPGKKVRAHAPRSPWPRWPPQCLLQLRAPPATCTCAPHPAGTHAARPSQAPIDPPRWTSFVLLPSFPVRCTSRRRTSCRPTP